MASQSATDLSARAWSRDHLVLGAGIALAVFAGSLGLLAVGETDGGGGEIRLPEVLFAALASLPLVA